VIRLGVMTFPTDTSARPDDLAAAVETRGLSTLLFAEHTHIPLEATPRPRGGEIPDEYRHVLDPFVALTAAASATTSLRIGTGVCLIGQRDPIVTAKIVSSLDHLSNGRVVLGVGFGWHLREMRDHSVDPDRRRARVREHVEAMRALWTHEVAEYQGEFVHLSPSWQWPKPVQQPGPPILLGADPGPDTFRQVARWADGWYPNRRYDHIDADIGQIKDAAFAFGRDPEALEFMAFVDEPDPDLLPMLERAGVTTAIVPLPSVGMTTLEPVLDSYALAGDQARVIGH
jgi:probable F420-dependent oxidoreductase